MPPSVMRDHAIAPLAEEEHLPVPVVRGKRPTMGENDRLTRSPILVINLRAILRCDPCHTSSWLLRRCGCKSLFRYRANCYNRPPNDHSRLPSVHLQTRITPPMPLE